jgi:hypothetical protein
MVQSTVTLFPVIKRHFLSATADVQSVALVCFLLLLTSSAPAQRGALTAPRNIAQLSAQAATIIRGHVISIIVQPDPKLKNLTTVVVSVRVEEVLKGNAGAVFTFRQFIWDIRDRYDAAGYRKGQELLLLMNAPSRYGLSSPAGMDQGRFRIVRSAAGVDAINGRGNAGLFQGVPELAARKKVQLSPRALTLARTHHGGPVALDQLEEVIRQFARSGK